MEDEGERGENGGGEGEGGEGERGEARSRRRTSPSKEAARVVATKAEAATILVKVIILSGEES